MNMWTFGCRDWYIWQTCNNFIIKWHFVDFDLCNPYLIYDLYPSHVFCSTDGNVKLSVQEISRTGHNNIIFCFPCSLCLVTPQAGESGNWTRFVVTFDDFLFVPCGGCKKSPRTFNQWCYIFDHWRSFSTTLLLCIHVMWYF
jgi:hypothetical protein